jgi:hypothetical protein
MCFTSKVTSKYMYMHLISCCFVSLIRRLKSAVNKISKVLSFDAISHSIQNKKFKAEGKRFIVFYASNLSIPILYYYRSAQKWTKWLVGLQRHQKSKVSHKSTVNCVDTCTLSNFHFPVNILLYSVQFW